MLRLRYLLLLFLSIPAYSQSNQLPQTVDSIPIADDLDYLLQRINTINGVSSSGTLSSLPLWSSDNNGNIFNNNSGKIGVNTISPQFQLDVKGSINTNSTLSANNAQFGGGTTVSTFSNTGNLALVDNSTITFPTNLYISTPSATNFAIGMQQLAGYYSLSINTNTFLANVPLSVWGQIRTYDAGGSEGGGQMVMIGKTGKKWDWSVGIPAGGVDGSMVMDESGILATLICTASSGGNAKCGVVTAQPAYAWDVTGDINNTGVYRSNTTAGIGRTCNSNQVPNADTTLGGIVTGGTCDAVRDNQVKLTTNAIISGLFGDNRVSISSAATNFANQSLLSTSISSFTQVALTSLSSNTVIYANSSTQTASLPQMGSGGLVIGSGVGIAPSTGTLTGTSNQVTVTNAAGSITLSLPQNINSGASPTFSGTNFSNIQAGSLVNGPLSSSIFPSSSVFAVNAIIWQSTHNFNYPVTFISSITVLNSSITLTGTNGYISGSSSITASSFFGDGSNLTGITGLLTGGQANFIPRWTNATTQGLSDIWDQNSPVVKTSMTVQGIEQVQGIFQVGTTTTVYTSNNGGSSLIGGQEIVQGTMTVIGNAFSVGGSTLTVASGNLTVASSVTANAFFGNGSALTGITATAGGSTGQIQFNSNGTQLGGASNLIYSNNVLTVLQGSSVTVNDQFQVGGSTLIVTNSNVGIGTTNPATLLDIEGGNATLGGSAIPTLAIKSNTSGTNYARIEMDNNIGDNLLIQKRSPGYTGTSLGIPNSGLSVFIDNSTAGNSNGMLFWVSNSTPIYFATNSTERMRIDGSGNVGIGTTNPGSPLDVSPYAGIRIGSVLSGGGYTKLQLYNAAAGSNSSAFQINLDSSTGDAFPLWQVAMDVNTSGQDLEFNDAGNTRLLLKKGGNVGINQTSPSGIFHVKQSANGAVNGIRIERSDGARKWAIGSDSNNDLLQIQDGSGNSNITIEQGIGVGISTGIPSNTLDVNGGITSRGINTLGYSTDKNPKGLVSNAIWAQSADGATQSSGCFVVVGFDINSSAIVDSTSQIQFTSTTTVSYNWISNSTIPGVLLESCAPGVSCRVQIDGIARVVNDGSGPGKYIQSSGTRCKVTSENQRDAVTAGMWFSGPDGSANNWIRITGP